MTDGGNLLMLHNAQAIKRYLADFSLMTDAWYGRGDADALEEARQTMYVMNEMLLMKHPLGRDPRTHLGAYDAVEVPEGGVRCPQCDAMLMQTVNGEWGCGICDTIYTLVTWVLVARRSPNYVFLEEVPEHGTE
jgi:hypothetical protein